MLVTVDLPIYKGDGMKSNPVTWFSIPSDDIEASSKFYSDVFGWNITPKITEKNPAFDYKVAVNTESDDQFIPHEAGRLNGCIIKKDMGISHTAILITVPNLDEAAERIKAGGGSIISERLEMSTLPGKFFWQQTLMVI